PHAGGRWGPHLGGRGGRATDAREPARRLPRARPVDLAPSRGLRPRIPGRRPSGPSARAQPSVLHSFPSKPCLEGEMVKGARVTGSSGALGRAIAERLAEDGFDLALHYRSGRQEAEKLAASLSASGIEARAYQADICKGPEVHRMVERVEGELGPIGV